MIGIRAQTGGVRKTEVRARVRDRVEAQRLDPADDFHRAPPVIEDVVARFDPSPFRFTGHGPGARDVPAARVRIGQVFAVEAHPCSLIGDRHVLRRHRHRTFGPGRFDPGAPPPAVDANAIEKDAVAKDTSPAEAQPIVELAGRERGTDLQGRERLDGLLVEGPDHEPSRERTAPALGL